MDDLFTNKMYRTFCVFLELPTTNFSARGLARRLTISHATVLKHLDTLERKGLIRRNDDSLYVTYYANSTSIWFRFYQRQQLVWSLMDCGIIQHLEKQTLPSCIVLFGSGARGTLMPNSDIDLFVEATAVGLSLKKYERQLQRTVNILFDTSIRNLSEELARNIMNGVILYGRL